MATVQHLVMDNKKRRPIIYRTKLDLNKTFKEATKAIGVAQDGSEFSENKTNEGVEKISEEKEVVEKEQRNELLAKEKEVEKKKLPASNKGKVPRTSRLQKRPPFTIWGRNDGQRLELCWGFNGEWRRRKKQHEEEGELLNFSALAE
ncbi:hypothetical protein JHK86_022558 [Glycine max]|nr:hypothetical protein JHK86_022558 [Glycine max]